MILADTSIWIEFLRASPHVFPYLRHEMEHQNVVAVECVFGELLQGTKNQRESQIVVGYWNNLPKRDERGLWLEAGILSSQTRLSAKGVGLIDAFLVRFARKYGCSIWTLDKKLTSVLASDELYSRP